MALQHYQILEIGICHSYHQMWCHMPGYLVYQSNISLDQEGKSAIFCIHIYWQTNCMTFKQSIITGNINFLKS